ncbi:RNA polymerase sigma-70 factor [Arenibacter troitsensis]|uniref:RNA polymerase sigma factor n=1 Tax=Arenibacter troitsensis TaxID=188872 RepID=A0A1X7IH49_9FLAO|nr:RNA polymerase sigma-70 factor [Arenibacter troitsensis]SMG13982.1 RNA polymerase sigma-70 factor, ECF subfamily [Arenibacter troitsensis]
MTKNRVEGDRLLVNELIKGNEKAFRKLFDSYRNDLYKFSLSMVCSEEYAEEIVQDVFMKIWIKRRSLKPEMSFKSYLFTITRNKTIKFLKKAANNRKLREAVFYGKQKFVDSTDLYVRELELESLKQKALDKLSPRRRKIFEMSRNENKSYEEIAEELGISISTVRNQMSTSLEILRDFILKNKEIGLGLLLFYTDWV